MSLEVSPAPAVEPVDVPTRRAARSRTVVARRGERAQAFVTAVLLLVLLAGDLLVAYQLPVRESACADRLCGPALGVAGASLAVGLLAVVVWLVGDRRRDRGRGTGLCWAALVLAALPWAFVTLRLQWW
jgi:hypothetical protein